MPADEPDGCRIIDDGGSQVDAIEEVTTPGEVPGALLVRVGPVFDNGSERGEPGIWVEYQPQYMASMPQGPVLLTPAAWEKLAALVDDRLSRYGAMTRAERFTRAVRAVHQRYKESCAEAAELRQHVSYLEMELQRYKDMVTAQTELAASAEAALEGGYVTDGGKVTPSCLHRAAEVV
jgi:hypothetical protein